MKTKLIILLCSFLVGCGSDVTTDSVRAAQERIKAESNVLAKTRLTSGYDIISFEHDGHRWVTKDNYHGNFLLHHPSCPCTTQPK